METDRNPLPKVDLFPRVSRVARSIGRAASFFPTEAPDFMSDHYHGRPVKTEAEQLQLDYEVGHAVATGSMSIEEAVGVEGGRA